MHLKSWDWRHTPAMVDDIAGPSIYPYILKNKAKQSSQESHWNLE